MARVLNAIGTLDFSHFVASGGSSVILTLFLFFLIAQVGRFFSKRIHEDESAAEKRLNESGFADAIWSARVAVIISVVYMIATIILANVGLTFLSYMYIACIMYNVQFFLPALFLSPAYSKFSVVANFILASAFCFAAGGYGSGLNDKNRTPVRDDFIVLIIVKDCELVAEKKRLSIPTQVKLILPGWLSKLLVD